MAPKNNTPTSPSSSNPVKDKKKDDDKIAIPDLPPIRGNPVPRSPRLVKKAPDPIDSKTTQQVNHDQNAHRFDHYKAANNTHYYSTNGSHSTQDYFNSIIHSQSVDHRGNYHPNQIPPVYRSPQYDVNFSQSMEIPPEQQNLFEKVDSFSNKFSSHNHLSPNDHFHSHAGINKNNADSNSHYGSQNLNPYGIPNQSHHHNPPHHLYTPYPPMHYPTHQFNPMQNVYNPYPPVFVPLQIPPIPHSHSNQQNNKNKNKNTPSPHHSPVPQFGFSPHQSIPNKSNIPNLNAVNGNGTSSTPLPTMPTNPSQQHHSPTTSSISTPNIPRVSTPVIPPNVPNASVPHENTQSVPAPTVPVPNAHQPNQNLPFHGAPTNLPNPVPNSGSDFGSSMFNQNEFLLSIDKKVKYDTIDTEIGKRELQDDSQQSLEIYFDSIMRCINVGFQTQFTFLPTFQELDANLSFRQRFLGKLFGNNLRKASASFNMLGQILKEKMKKESCISPDKCPKASVIINDNDELDGWEIFELLLKKRLVSCGAPPDRNLNVELALLTLNENETLQAFYLRTKNILKDYRIQMVKFQHLIPHFNIVKRFVTELMRVEEYRVFMVIYQQQLLQLQLLHGEYGAQQYLTFSITDIYEHLTQNVVPVKSAKSLLPSPNVASSNNSEGKSTFPTPKIAYIAPDDDIDDNVLDIDDWYDHHEEQQAVISLMKRKARPFCNACLTPGHDETRCFLRGPHFRPKELTQRINVFNQQNGDKPPPGTELPKWNPRTPPADMNSSKKKATNRDRLQEVSNEPKKSMRPFANTPTKTSVKPKVNFANGIQNCDELKQDNNPVLANLTENMDGLELIDVEEISVDSSEQSMDDSDMQPIISTMTDTNGLIDSPVPFNYGSSMENIKIYEHTPSRLLVEFKKRTSSSKHQAMMWMKRISKDVERVKLHNFSMYSNLNFQVDSGANVWAVTDPKVLVFYHSNPTSVEAVNGETFTSEGWGGMLIKLKNKVYLCSPVYVYSGNPRNTMSLGALKSASGFMNASVNIHETVELIDRHGVKAIIPTVVSNDLDFVTLEIVTFIPLSTKSKDQINAVMTRSQRAKSKLLKQSENEVKHDTSVLKLENHHLRFNNKIMAHIAMFYVLLHSHASPQQEAINKMNCVIYNNNRFKFTQPSVNTAISSYTTESSTYKTIPIMGMLSRTIMRTQNPQYIYKMLHLALGHASKSTIQLMCEKLSIDNLPKPATFTKFLCECDVCHKMKPLKVPKGPTTNVSIYENFMCLHMDFQFFGVKSLRGFTTALTIVCAHSSYPFAFPLKSKTPPLDVVKWFIMTVRKMGYKALFIRVDEDKALAGSSEFNKLLIEMNCILQTTGGGNSENNGKVERSHRTLADMVRSSLGTAKIIFGSKLPKKLKITMFWCFALQNACEKLRRLYNKNRGNTPYFMVHNVKPKLSDLAIFGSFVTIVNPNKAKMPKLNERSKECYFLGFGNNVRNILYWNPQQPYTYSRAHHAIINDVKTFDAVQHIFSTNVHSDTDKLKDENEEINLIFSDSAFPSKDILSFKFKIPTYPTTVGIEILDDVTLNLPYIKSCVYNSVAYRNIPSKFRRNMFLININGESPITSQFAYDLIKEIQKSPVKELELDLVIRDTPIKVTSLEVTRAMFDQLPRFNQNRPSISRLEVRHKPAAHDHIIASAIKPKKPKLFHECMRSPFKQAWIAACFIMFNKNKNLAVFSLPVKKKDLPEGTRVFPTILVPDIKPTDVPTLFEAKMRDCTVGTKQEKGIDYPQSYTPVGNSCTLKIVLALTAAILNTLGIFDVKNAFQTSIAPKEYRIWVSCPPLYLEWLKLYENFQYDPTEEYARQCFNGNQGQRAASKIWYDVLSKILLKYGFKRCTVDHALFVKPLDDNKWFYCLISTDDILCSYPSEKDFQDLFQYLNQFFGLTTQTGNVLTYLNMRIVQTEDIITLDQGDYVFEMLSSYYGYEIDKIKTCNTPLRADAAFERELYEAIPLTQEELKHYCIQYKGGFRHHIGKLQHAANQTRLDIMLSVQRLAEFSNSPTSIAFECIGRHYRYLAKDPLRPLTFRKGSHLQGNVTLSYISTPDESTTITIPQHLSLFTDAEFARSLSDRRTWYCSVIMLCGVAIQMKVKKTTTVMTHTTDAELHGAFDGVRKLLPLRRMLEFMGYPAPLPTPLYIDNAAVDAVIDSNRLTPRCRHLDIPIAYLHQEKERSYEQFLIRTQQMLADFGTKPLVHAVHKKFKYWLTGAEFLPKEGSLHFKLLQMQYYETSYVDILKLMNDAS